MYGGGTIVRVNICVARTVVLDQFYRLEPLSRRRSFSEKLGTLWPQRFDSL